MKRSVETVLEHLSFELLSARDTWLTVPVMLGVAWGQGTPGTPQRSLWWRVLPSCGLTQVF